jgi:hypothetical protein
MTTHHNPFRHHRLHHLHTFFGLLAAGALVAAIVEELRKPEAEREWHGFVGGVIPYDFRMPTAAKLMDKLWNPEGPIVSSKVFGVGWDPNLGRIVEEVKQIPKIKAAVENAVDKVEDVIDKVSDKVGDAAGGKESANDVVEETIVVKLGDDHPFS